MERKILAEKGIKGNAVLGIFYMILFVALVIFILCKASLSFYVIFVCLVLLGLAFWCRYFAFNNLRLPKVMLTYDDNGIYINYKNNEIYNISKLEPGEYKIAIIFVLGNVQYYQ